MLVAVSALGPLALNIFMPAMPNLKDAFATDYGTIQLTLSLYLAGLAASQLVYGPLSDRYGRRPMLLAGLVLFVIGSAGGLAAAGIGQLIAARLVQAVGGCAGLVLGRAMVRDLYSRERAAGMIAYMTMAMVVAPMLAPLLGGYLTEWFGWRSTLVFTVAAGAAVLALAVPLLRETNHDRQPLPGIGGMLSSYRALLRVPAFRCYAFQISFSTAGFFAFLGGAPYVVIDLMGRSPAEYGLYFALGAAGYMVGNFLAGRHSARLGIDRMIGIGVIVSLAATATMLVLALAGVDHPLALFLPLTAFALGNGMSLPNGLAGAISVNPRIAGAASGLAGFLQMGAGTLASIVAGVIVLHGAAAMILVMLTASALAVYFWVALRRFARQSPGDADQPAARSRTA